MSNPITRWDEWFGDDNLTTDERILAAPPSRSAENAARTFIARGKRSILDLACGIGRDTFHLESRGLDVVGVDASFNGLRVAQQIACERGALAHLLTGDARQLPFRDGSFEGVYCFGLLHEFVGEGYESQVACVMREMRRVLAPSGLAVLTVLAGDPETGLPKVQFFTREMLDATTRQLCTLEVQEYDDVGCTCRSDYHIWYGVFERGG
jgi:SAM-dependent methyltransferase